MNKQGKNGIDWLVGGYTWGPIVGCDGPDGQPCPYCYGRTFSKRRMGEYGQQPVGEEFKPRFLPERLDGPLKVRKPSRIFTGSMGDMFGEKVEPAWVRQVWDVMWKASQHTFIILTKRPDRMQTWAQENASMRHFGWGDETKHSPMKPGDLIPMDELYHRARCGWANGQEDYVCDHPDKARPTDEETCFDYDCPIAYPAAREDIEERDPNMFADNYAPYPDSEPTDWVVLHSRPRYAFASNVWLGVSVTNQQDADERIPWLLKTPAAVRFISYEPMQEPVTFRPKAGSLSELMCLMRSGEASKLRMLDGISWLILGAETGHRAGKAIPKREWIEGVVSQCRVAGVPVFEKGSLADVVGRALIQEYPGKWRRPMPPRKTTRQGEIAEAQALLADLPEDCVIERMGLEGRLKKLQAEVHRG